MNWAEAFASVASAALPVLAAIAGSVSTFWFSERKAKREAREKAANAQIDAETAFLRSRYDIYARYIDAVNEFGVAMNAPVGTVARVDDIKSAIRNIEASLLALELLAGKDVIEPARALRKYAFDWGDMALRDKLDIGLPAHQFDLEKFELIGAMRQDLEGLRSKLPQNFFNSLDLGRK